MKIIGTFRNFIALEASGGIVLMAASLLAMLAANSPLADYYATFAGQSQHAINDGLMVLFFLVVGLEIQMELKEGELSTRAKAILPFIAAGGGVIVPALIFAWFNQGGESMRGWAIPCATDIAFALGVLSLFGSRVPHSLKVFLMAVAVIDDIIAVLIIAIFYTESVVREALMLAAGAVLLIMAMRHLKLNHAWLYLFCGAALWWFVLQSGVHATVAGVLLGLLIPLPIARKLMHALHPYVAYGVMPVFALANAGVPLSGIRAGDLLHPLPLGIITGLFFGKQIGILFSCWICHKFRIAPRPAGSSWGQVYAVAVLAGIGFTMSLFIGTLAFTDVANMQLVRLGVLLGSLLSALAGSALLWYALVPKKK